MRPFPVFVDTGGWYALCDLHDAHVRVAQDTWRSLVVKGYPLVTTNLVVGETYTLLRQRVGHDAAWDFLRVVDQTRRLTRVHVPPELEPLAYDLLRQYHDHDFSFVDATSFMLMRTERITAAFAFDHHFATAGFSRVPLDLPVY